MELLKRDDGQSDNSYCFLKLDGIVRGMMDGDYSVKFSA